MRDNDFESICILLSVLRVFCPPWQLKVMPRPWLAGVGSIQWNTKHLFWSRGCKNTRGQSWRFRKKLSTQPELVPMRPHTSEVADYFFNLQFWPLIFMQPLQQNECLVAHLKKSICLDPDAQGSGTILRDIFRGLKPPKSLHKMQI